MGLGGISTVSSKCRGLLLGRGLAAKCPPTSARSDCARVLLGEVRRIEVATAGWFRELRSGRRECDPRETRVWATDARRVLGLPNMSDDRALGRQIPLWRRTESVQYWAPDRLAWLVKARGV